MIIIEKIIVFSKMDSTKIVKATVSSIIDNNKIK